MTCSPERYEAAFLTTGKPQTLGCRCLDHAGPANKPPQEQYVCQVIGNLAARGFSAWTANARRIPQ